jgi:hypothetical protein
MIIRTKTPYLMQAGGEGAAGQKPKESLVQGALLRLTGATTVSILAAVECHKDFTGPLSKVDLLNGLMALTEISVLG